MSAVLLKVLSLSQYYPNHQGGRGYAISKQEVRWLERLLTFVIGQQQGGPVRSPGSNI